MNENKIFIRKDHFFFMCTIITLWKNMYVQNLPQLFANQSHYLLRGHCTPTHVQYTFNNLTENVLHSTTNKAYLFPPPVTNRTCQHLPPFSPTQKCYFPFIQLYIQSLWLTSTLSWRYFSQGKFNAAKYIKFLWRENKNLDLRNNYQFFPLTV